MYKTNEEKGITLIALVVTIVVLLILAGVSISMLFGDNGIIKRAQEAKERSEIAEERELVELSAMGALARDKWGEITYDNLDEELKINLGDRDYTLDGTGPFTVTYVDSGRMYTVETDGTVTEAGKDETGIAIKFAYTYENQQLNVDELPNVKEVTSENIPIPQGFYYVGGTKDGGVVISDVEEDDLNNSKQGNQFVWVPVNQNQKLMVNITSKQEMTEIIITYPDGTPSTINVSGKTYSSEIEMTFNGIYKVEVKTATTSKTSSRRISSLYAEDAKISTLALAEQLRIFATEEYNTVSEFLEAKGVDSIEQFLNNTDYSSMVEYMTNENVYIEELKEEIEDSYKEWLKYVVDDGQNPESVNKYGGYYIGRFEAGDGNATSPRTSSSLDTNKLVSKKGAYSYIYASCNDAISLSSGMYSENSAVTSQLMTGAGCDRALNWIIETDDKTEHEVIIDSRSWGNYNNSTGNAAINAGESNLNYTTGRSEYWKANNIYDLAGNMWEWTQETLSGNYMDRGGGYDSLGEINPASTHYYGRQDPPGPDWEDDNDSFRVELYINV